MSKSSERRISKAYRKRKDMREQLIRARRKGKEVPDEALRAVDSRFEDFLGREKAKLERRRVTFDYVE